MMLRKVSTMSEYANIYCPAFESTKGGTQFDESGRWVSGLLSEFCTVQVRFTEYGGFCISGGLIIHKYIYIFVTKRSVSNIVDGQFSGLSIRRGSTV